MALTDFGALTDAQKKVWSQKTWMNGRDQSFWFSNGFVASSESDQNRPVQLINSLTKTSRGLSVVMQLVRDLVGDGVSGDNVMDGNEEALINDQQTIQIDQIRNAVKSAGEMSEQATVVRFRAEARNKLSFWLGDKLDELMFLTASGRAYTLKTDGSTRSGSQLPNLNFASDVVAASTNRILYTGSATSEATLTTSDIITWDFLIGAKATAHRKKLNPIREGGREYFVVVLSSEQARDLRRDSDYINARKDALPRSTKNPLFTGALTAVEGLVIHEHNKTFNTLGLTSGVDKWGSGSNVDGAQALMLGAQAMGFAAIEAPFMRESDNTDYGNRPGLAFGRKFGMLKPQFYSPVDEATEDFSVLSLKTAAAA